MTGAPVVLGLVGNPNCGKSTLFNALTGARQEVGNWPGVTVEKKSGRYRHDEVDYEVVDTPGVYSLGAPIGVSEDERVACEFILSRQAALIVNIVDASNLERNLYLTTQLLEMRVPVVVALNMMDIAARRGLKIDAQALQERLGCPVLEVVASRGTGIAALKACIAQHRAAGNALATEPRYDDVIECEVGRIVAGLAAQGVAHSRWHALRLLEGDALMTGETAAALEPLIAEARARIEAETDVEADIAVADARFGLITDIVATVLTRPRNASRTFSDRVDRIVLNRWLGIPVFLIMMYLMFVFTISVGGAFIDAFDKGTEALLVTGGTALLTTLGLPEWLVVVLANGVGGGLQTVASFIPVIACLYLFLSVLEDSGYMARAAFVMDRAMRAIGLPGKSFVPLIIGFGCNVPAIMATRTLESRRDRVLTVMMAPFMSCGARLPVYALFAAAFFPTNGQNLVFGLYAIGILVAIGTGFLLKSTVMRGEVSPFIMELPPYHLPSLTTVGRRAWDRLKTFIFRAGRLIVPVVLALNVANAVGTDGSFGHQDRADSLLSAIGRGIVPVFGPMGMTDDNWPAAVGVFTGILAKETVVGTLNALYTQLGEDGAAERREEASGVAAQFLAALATIPENLGKALHSLVDPLHREATDGASGADMAPAGLSAMASRFDGQAAAFAYLLMILLYMPCVATIGAIYQEIGWRWTVFAAAWTTGLGWCAATVFYQVARFGRHPGTSLFWIAACSAALMAAMVALHRAGQAVARQPPQAPPGPALGDRLEEVGP